MDVNSNVSDKYAKPNNKILKILILGGGPIGLFVGYKLLKSNHEITIFEKRKKYTRHNILSLKETTKVDTLSLIPSEIMEELNTNSSFSNLNPGTHTDKCYKKFLREKPYLMVSSTNYYIVISELETAFEKYFKLYGGNLIRPMIAESFSDIKVENNILIYSENANHYSINMSKFDIIFINDGANSFYRNIYFKTTTYTEKIEDNVLRYGLNKDKNEIKVATNIDDIEPLAYGLIFIHNIENKKEFQEKFHTIDKLQKDIDFDLVLELDNKDNEFLKGLKVKEILLENTESNNSNSSLNSQNLFRMFVSENYLYISILVNPVDIGEFKEKISNGNIPFDDLSHNIQLYLMFALYYNDLTELIDPRSNQNSIKLFPLNFSCAKQSCTFIKKENPKGQCNSPNLIKMYDSSRNPFQKQMLENINNLDNYYFVKNHYQCIMLCGDAMVSGNFHSGIVLNKNMIAVHNICQSIDQYIDAYPKDENGNLNNNFLRLLFFHGNISNQKVSHQIINKSIDALINFDAIDKDPTQYNFQEILTQLSEILLCKNSLAFVEFLVNNFGNETLQRILKYLLLPNKYKYSQILKNISKIKVLDSTFE